MEKVEENFKETLKLHEEHTMLSSEGEVILIASACIDKTIDENLTIFERDHGKEEEKILDEQVKYY